MKLILCDGFAFLDEWYKHHENIFLEIWFLSIDVLDERHYGIFDFRDHFGDKLIVFANSRDHVPWFIDDDLIDAVGFTHLPFNHPRQIVDCFDEEVGLLWEFMIAHSTYHIQYLNISNNVSKSLSINKSSGFAIKSLNSSTNLYTNLYSENWHNTWTISKAINFNDYASYFFTRILFVIDHAADSNGISNFLEVVMYFIITMRTTDKFIFYYLEAKDISSTYRTFYGSSYLLMILMNISITFWWRSGLVYVRSLKIPKIINRRVCGYSGYCPL